MGGSIRIVRLAGIDLRVHISWLLIFGLVVLGRAESLPFEYPRWSDQQVLVVAAVTALLFFASVVAHEFAHAIVARAFHMEVSSITLFLLGGVANLTKEPVSARAEFFMAFAGPFTSFVIGGIGVAIASLGGGLPDSVRAIADYVGPVNVVLGFFNMLPGFPLDGGRVLRATIWAVRRDRHVATRIAARGGQLVAILLGLAGAYFIFRAHDTFGAWYFLIAYFLWSAATSSIAQERANAAVSGARVRQLMTPSVHTVDASMTIGHVVRDFILPLNLRAVPVTADGKLAGLVTITDLRAVDQERWPTTPVSEIMRPALTLAAVAPDDPLSRALERFGETDVPILPVIEDGQLVAVLYYEALEGYIRMRQVLGFDVAGRR